MEKFTPLNYKIRLQPDLVNFTFAACAEILLDTPNWVKEIPLNILEIAVWSCNVLEENKWVACPFLVNTQKEEFRILLPETMTGNITVRIDYQGHINDKMAGFYRSGYMRRKKQKFIAVTQFEEGDARRAFPCMDHPAKKATFDIEMDVEKNLVAISNSPIKSETILDNGKKRVAFDRTPKMSTYLVFFGVGEFQFLIDQNDPRVRVVTLPTKKKYAPLGLKFGRKALEFSEEYYGISYPLSKLDLIAIPDFAFGAMENWGAITFRENLLLYYPKITSKSGQQRICEVIAHEIAHQWFGNLVTPSDWKYLWLNESFATYFGYGVVDHYYPKWDTWEQFLHGMTTSAMSRDALHQTTAIEIPSGEHVVINTSTAPIIYNKGGSILRQIEGYIGKDNFRKGLQDYLSTHKYGSADSHHLWESFENVSNQPIGSMMKSWIEQPGFPMVEVMRAGHTLVLKQNRFTYLPKDFDQKWVIPIIISLFFDNGTSHQMTTLLDHTQKAIDIPADTVAYKINDRQTGFYRVKYQDPENLEALGRRISDQSLSTEDRWGLQNDLYAWVKRGDVSVNNYLQFLSHYREETAYLPLIGIVSSLSELYRVLDADYKEKISGWARPWYEEILEKIGYEPGKAEKNTVSLLREQLIWEAALLGSTRINEFARYQFSALLYGTPVHSDLIRCVMQVAALTGDAQVFDWFEGRFRASEIEHERLNILVALGCFKDETLIKKSQSYVLETIPARNKVIPVVAMASNPHAISSMWDWYVSNLREIEKFHPLLYERVIASIVPVAGMERADEVKAFFEDYMQKTDTAKDVVKLSLERMDINLRMRSIN
ncbi:MAG: M1 family metallopeptidase [Deltaproteobacteria bacterium]|nr:M1 family metallopeptidase [Deltaproteobacteria bacterium]MBW2320603.1 M1 family metallopeptidase [Deltaproteobacteria bacterium]